MCHALYLLEALLLLFTNTGIVVCFDKTQNILEQE